MFDLYDGYGTRTGVDAPPHFGHWGGGGGHHGHHGHHGGGFRGGFWGGGYPWLYDGYYPVAVEPELPLAWVTIRVDGREVGSGEIVYGRALVVEQYLRSITPGGPRFLELLVDRRIVLFRGQVSDATVTWVRNRLGL